MKDRTGADKILIAVSLLLGLSSFLTFALYFYSANYGTYTYTNIIVAGPILSFIGMIISILTRRSRKKHSMLWMCGFITCLFGFIVCVFIIVLLTMIMVEAFDGTWLWFGYVFSIVFTLMDNLQGQISTIQ